MIYRLYMILALCLVIPHISSAQELIAEGLDHRFNVHINLDRAGISGVCVINEMPDVVLGAIINEFGISMLSFRYTTKGERVKIIDVIYQLDRCYIKRVLRRDLKTIIPHLIGEEGVDGYRYCNHRYKIEYLFIPQT